MNSLSQANQAILKNVVDTRYVPIIRAIEGAIENFAPIWLDMAFKDGEIADKPSFSKRIADIWRQFGQNCMIYICDTTTWWIYQTKPSFCTGKNINLQGMGGGHIYDDLAWLGWEKTGTLNHSTQQDYATRLATAGSPQLLVETGAGMDTSRLIELRRAQEEWGWLFVAHDISPRLLQQAVQAGVLNMLYCALPPVYIGDLIGAVSWDTTMSMKDTLSSLAFGQINQLIHTCKENPNIQRVVVTQSLGEAWSSNKYPTHLQPNNPNFDTEIINYIARNPPKTSDMDLSPSSLLHLTQQIQHNVGTIMMEVGRNYLFNAAEKAGFVRFDTEISETSEDYPAEKSLEYIQNHYPYLLQRFQKNEINEIVLWPFWIHWRKNHKITTGQLRVTSQNSHFIVEKRRKYQVVEKPKNLTIQQIQRSNILTPRNMTTLSPFTYMDRLSERMRGIVTEGALGDIQRVSIFWNKAAYLMLYNAWAELHNEDVTEAFLHPGLLKSVNLSVK